MKEMPMRPADPGIELGLLLSRISNSVKNIRATADSYDPEVTKIAYALLHLRYLHNLNTDLNEEINRLMTESEILIESPEANTPEIKARRKEIADKTNELLEIQTDLEKQHMTIERAEAYVHNASKEHLAAAEHLLNLNAEAVKSIIDPVTGLN